MLMGTFDFEVSHLRFFRAIFSDFSQNFNTSFSWSNVAVKLGMKRDMLSGKN